MTVTGAAPSCPQCGEPIPDPPPKLCRNCRYPLVFVDRAPRLEAEAEGLETPTPVPQPVPPPAPEPAPPPQPAPAPPSLPQPALLTCPACGYGNTPGRTWCERCGRSLAPPTPPPPEPAPPPPTPPAWQRWLPGLAAGLAIALGIGVWLIWFAPSDPAPPPTSPTAPTAAPGPGVIPRREITATASSTLPGTRQQSWEAKRTVDGNPGTAWQSKGDGLPVTLRWEFARPVELESVEVHNGYQVDEARFWETARAARVTIVTDAGEQQVELADELGGQEFQLTGRTRYVEFRIASAHRENAVFPDLAVSEVTFSGVME